MQIDFIQFSITNKTKFPDQADFGSVQLYESGNWREQKNFCWKNKIFDALEAHIFNLKLNELSFLLGTSHVDSLGNA